MPGATRPACSRCRTSGATERDRVTTQLCMTDTYADLDEINARLAAGMTASDLAPVLPMLTALQERVQRL